MKVGWICLAWRRIQWTNLAPLKTRHNIMHYGSILHHTHSLFFAWHQFWLVINVLGTWQVHYGWYSWSLFSINLCSLLSGNLLLCCKPFYANLSTILKEWLGFSSSWLRGFSHGISCLMWMNDLCVWWFSDSCVQYW